MKTNKRLWKVIQSCKSKDYVKKLKKKHDKNYLTRIKSNLVGLYALHFLFITLFLNNWPNSRFENWAVTENTTSRYFGMNDVSVATVNMIPVYANTSKIYTLLRSRFFTVEIRLRPKMVFFSYRNYLHNFYGNFRKILIILSL